jgi:pilus assembly protein FimV
MLLDAGMTLTPPSGDAIAQRSEERAEESGGASVLSELSLSAEPAFAFNDGQHVEPESDVELADPTPATDEQTFEGDDFEDGINDGHSLEERVSAALSLYSAASPKGPAQESASIGVDPIDVVEEAPLLDAGPSAFENPLALEKSEAEQAGSFASNEDERGLQLAPLDAGLDAAEIPIAENFDKNESIHGVETNPVDSKLDLARAYLDMGDEDGARPVLMEVIKEGDLSQQAEARELLLRLEAS